jgi:PAS domain-containing protein
VAVTVFEDRYLVLDDDFTIVEVGPAARAMFGPLLGRPAYDAFPESERLFRPYYERAVRLQEPVEFATYYNGYALHLEVAPRGSDLVMRWTTLARLDLMTLEGLAASLDQALVAIEDLERRLRRRTARSQLHVVPDAR